MNVREVTKILFKIRSNLIDPKQKHAIWIAIKAIKYSRPRAIDVYKGKIELRITYEGNIPVDSTVVFKK